MTSFLRMVWLDVLHGLSTWRWWLVPPVFAAATFWFRWSVSFDFDDQRFRDVNQWDFALAYQAHPHFLLWVFALGFALLVGDCYIREREMGVDAMSLARGVSREAWWAARIVSLGVMALSYAVVGISIIALVGGLMSRFDLGPSPELLGRVRSVEWYSYWKAMHIAPFVAVTSLYLAFGLWIAGSVIVTASLIVRRTFVPFVVASAWIIISADPMGLHYRGTARLLNLVHLLSYEKHLGHERMPLGSFLAASTIALMGVALIGVWRARWIDV